MFDFICLGTECDPAIRLAQLAVCAFLGALFLQSGLDKVFNFKAELAWISEHFANTPFKNAVPQMLGMITVFELASGATCAIGGVVLLVSGTKDVALLGVTLAAASLVQLFAGQRIAKDYPGAAVIAPYFLVTLAGFALLAG